MNSLVHIKRTKKNKSSFIMNSLVHIKRTKKNKSSFIMSIYIRYVHNYVQYMTYFT